MKLIAIKDLKQPRQLKQRLLAGKGAKLDRKDAWSLLRGLMKELEIPEESQVLVFSKTSKQNDRINPQTVNVVLVEPEASTGQQEITNFITPVIKDQCSPIGMKTLPRVFMLIETCTVELCQPMSILGEVRRDPIDQHPNPGLMTVVDEITKIIR